MLNLRKSLEFEYFFRYRNYIVVHGVTDDAKLGLFARNCRGGRYFALCTQKEINAKLIINDIIKNKKRRLV